MKLKVLAAAALLFALCQPSAAEDYAAKADSFIKAFADQGRFQGSVLVAKDGEPLLRKGYGLANVEWEIPNAPDTKFRLGSITKQFTGMAVLQLVEQGKLALEDPVSRHYQDAPKTWEAITIHHLLTHTSGIPSYTDMPGFFDKHARDRKSPAEIVKLTQDQPLQFVPGERMKYNNTGYVLLGHIIESASGMTYADYVRTKIFEPLGMKDTGYDEHGRVIKRRAAGYNPDGSNAPYLDMSLPHAAGSLYSTVDDLLIWDAALYEGKLLTKESYEKFFTPFRNNYAYGWSVDQKFGKKLVSHGGGIHGFSTMLHRVPDDRLTVIVLANKVGPAGQIGDGLVKLFYGQPVETPVQRKTILLSADQVAPLVAVYELGPQFSLNVTQKDNKAYVQKIGEPAVMEMRAIDKDKFYVNEVDAELVFERDASGKVTGVVLHQRGRQTPGKRR